MSKRPHVYFDNIIFALQQSGGISTYWTELLRRIDRDNSTLLQPTEHQNIACQALDFAAFPHVLYTPCANRRHRYFSVKLPDIREGIFHSSYYRSCSRAHVKSVSTVADFTYERFRSGLPAWVHSWQKNACIRRAAAVICISESTRDDLFRFVPDMDPAKVHVIYLGVSSVFRQVPAHEITLTAPLQFVRNLQKPYLLYVGDRREYKNFSFALRVLASLPAFAMVVVGTNPVTSEEAHNLQATGVANRVHFVGGIPQEQINNLYNLAHCLIYPSSYEGFGFPVVEAIRAGCPVVCLRVSSLPEAYGPQGLMLHNLDVQEFRDAIVALGRDEVRQRIVTEANAHGKQFTWERCVEQTEQVYAQVWEEGR